MIDYKPFLLSVIAVGLGIPAIALGIEVGARVMQRLWPSYEVLYLEPHRVLGWRQKPGLRYHWAGYHWYAADFSVPIEINSHGFRDLERSRAKPAGVTRIALIGDSMVEALQVPLELTAGQLLEARLNTADGNRFEVLNFGVSSFGVGQYLLVWLEAARHFDVDYVVILLSPGQMQRTTDPHQKGGLRATSGRYLAVRPTFVAGDQGLRVIPAPEFESFRQLQADLIAKEFSGERSRVRSSSYLARLIRKWQARPGSPSAGFAAGKASRLDLSLNMQILNALRASTEAAGARLIVADYSRLEAKASEISDSLVSFCTQFELPYLDVGQRLVETSIETGEPVRWEHDLHFNEAGNRIFADALGEWFIANEELRLEVARGDRQPEDASKLTR